MARKKILVLASTYPRWKNDHEPNFVHELARRQAAGFDVLALAPHTENAQVREVLDGVEIYRFRYAPARFETLVNDGGIMANLQRQAWKWLLVPPFLAGFTLACIRLVWRNEISAIHAHWIIPQGLVASIARLVSGKRIPLLLTSHGADIYTLRGRLTSAIKRWVLRRADFITVVSRGMLAPLRALNVDSGKTRVLPMGVDVLGLFTPDSSVERSVHTLLFVGRLVEKKGLDILIEALPAVVQKIPGARLEIVGFGPEEQKLRAQAERLGLNGSVIFLGAKPQNELPAQYRRATVFVAPFVQSANGDQEGLGLVSVEAVACGCPVITSDIPATADVFTDDTMRVKSGDVMALSEAVVRILSMTVAERSVLAAAQRKCVIERFGWEHVAESYNSILSGMMEMASQAK